MPSKSRTRLGEVSIQRALFLAAALVVGAVTAAHADEPLDQLVPRAERGDAAAQSELGWKYAKGDGVTQNYPEAVKWFRKAADQDHAASQSNLGLRSEEHTSELQSP